MSGFRVASALAVVLGVLSACDEAPTDPAPRTSSEPSLTSTATAAPPLAGFTASGSIPLGSKGYTLIGIAPADGYVRVRTVGGIRYTANPGYDEEPCGGIAGSSGCLWPQAPYASGTAMGAGIGGSALRVHLLVGGAEWAPRELPGGVLEWIVPVRAGARIEARRASLDIFKQFCSYDPAIPCEPPIHAYTLEPVGLAGVYVEGVVPLRVLGPSGAAGDTARVAPGQEATFTIEAVDGITRTQWYFLAWEGSVRMLGNCAGQMTCTVIPPTRGVVIVYGQWNGYTFGSEYLHIKAAVPELKLTCPQTVTRGGTISCSAAAPGATLQVLKWTFRDSIAYAASNSSGSSTWGGIMVVSGEMQVTALVNGDTATATQAIRVTPRSWSRLRISIREENPNHLPHPTQVDSPGRLADIHVDSIRSMPIGAISEGPNAGWFYLSGQLPRIPIVVHINEPAFAPGSAWYNLQTGGTYTRPNGTVAPQPYCSSHDVATLRRLTREHEGSLPSALTSHSDVFARFLRINPVHEVLEARIVHVEDLGSATVPKWFYGMYVADVAAPMENDVSQRHTNQAQSPGIVDPAPFPCYARPWN
jgi:hypothetical protein